MIKTEHKTKRINIRMTESELELLNKLTCRYDCSISDLIRYFIVNGEDLLNNE